MFRPETVKRWSPLFVLAALAACQKEEERSATEEKPDAGAIEKSAQIDPSIAKAVAAASAKPPQAQAAAPGGPPPNGIFAPGEADKEMKVGQPAKITLGSQGEEPRYALLGSSFHPKDKVKGTIQMAVQTDPRQGALPVDFNLVFEAKPPPALLAADGASALVVATVESAGVAAVGLPQDLSAELKKLKGSRIEYLVAPNGSAGSFVATPSKAATNPDMNRTFSALSDALATLTLPFPDKPVGTGAFWMATTRESVMALDTVTYRMIRVQRADPTQVTLTLETKRYAASDRFDLVEPGKWTLMEFQSVAEGTAMIAHGQPLPYKGLVALNFAAGLSEKQKPDQQGTVMVQGQARFTFADLEDPAGKAVTGSQPASPAAGAPVAPAPPAPPIQ